MLSVINRGTQVNDETENIPFKVIDGYLPNNNQGEPIGVIQLIGIPNPLFIDLPVTIKSGYTSKTVTPKER